METEFDLETAEALPNGAEIVMRREMLRAFAASGKRQWVVFAKWHGCCPWVTWWCDREGNATSGRYFRTRKEALRDYMIRANGG